VKVSGKLQRSANRTAKQNQKTTMKNTTTLDENALAWAPTQVYKRTMHHTWDPMQVSLVPGSSLRKCYNASVLNVNMIVLTSSAVAARPHTTVQAPSAAAAAAAIAAAAAAAMTAIVNTTSPCLLLLL
jgi:hypothetical protein